MMDEGERYLLREISSQARALQTRCDLLKQEARQLSGCIDDFLVSTKPQFPKKGKRKGLLRRRR